jgi:lysophospholipase L1-like esterase
LKNFFKILIINVCVLALLLLLADIFIGIVYKNNSAVPISSRYIQLREYPPNIDKNIEIILENGKKMNSSIKTDLNGFIAGPNSTYEYSNIDIAFLGGSTTENYFISPNFRFPYLVEEKIKQNFDSNFKIINAGVSGSSIANTNLILYSKIIDLKPSHVFVMHNVNDLVLLSKTMSYWDAPSGRAIILDRNEKNSTFKISAYSILKWIKDNFFSNIYRIFKNFFKIDDKFFARNMGGLGDEFSDYRNNFFLSDPAKLKIIETYFKNGLNTFINICKANGIQPVLMTQPNRIENKSKFFMNEFKKWGYNESQLDIFSRAYTRFNQIILEIANENEVHYIDLNAKVPQTDKYIYDSVHLSNEGSALASDIIFNFISEILFNFEGR